MARALQWTVGYVIPSAASRLQEIGIVMSGAEAGISSTFPASIAGFSNASPGTPNGSYRYEGVTSTSTHNHHSFGYLAGRGWTVAKIPFAWERLTRNASALTPATLNAGEIALLDTEITEAGSQGFTVVLDCHNYGLYYADGTFTGQTAGTGWAYALGQTAGTSGVVMTTEFTNFWSAMASHYLSNTTVAGFAIMNEPNGSFGGGGLTRANWYTAAQAAVTAIRAVDTTGRYILRVGGWQFSAVRNWPANNPSGAWITDSVAPANTWYEAHHYWDRNGSGVYSTYADAVSAAGSHGYSSTYNGTTYPDALYSQVLSDLDGFKTWLNSNGGAKGVIGEIGLPNQANATGPDETAWCALLSTYLAYAAQLGGIGVQSWVTSEDYSWPAMPLLVYGASNGWTSGVDSAGTDAAPWEAALAL